MEKINSTAKISVAKELTIKAIENGLITKTPSAVTTAKNVIVFYQTLLKNLNTDITDSDLNED